MLNFRSKTFWGGVTGIVGAAGGYFTGEMSAIPAIQMAGMSIMAIFLRDAVRKAGG